MEEQPNILEDKTYCTILPGVPSTLQVSGSQLFARITLGSWKNTDFIAQALEFYFIGLFGVQEIWIFISIQGDSEAVGSQTIFLKYFLHVNGQQQKTSWSQHSDTDFCTKCILAMNKIIGGNFQSSQKETCYLLCFLNAKLIVTHTIDKE